MSNVMLTTELSKQRNDVTFHFTCSPISRHWKSLFFIIDQGSLFLHTCPNVREVWARPSYESFLEVFWDEIFMVRNIVKTGQSSCSAVIVRKWRAFEMQFHLIEVSWSHNLRAIGPEKSNRVRKQPKLTFSNLNFFRLYFRSCISHLFNCVWWSSLHLKLVKAKFDMQTTFIVLSWNVGV